MSSRKGSNDSESNNENHEHLAKMQSCAAVSEWLDNEGYGRYR